MKQIIISVFLSIIIFFILNNKINKLKKITNNISYSDNLESGSNNEINDLNSFQQKITNIESDIINLNSIMNNRRAVSTSGGGDILNSFNITGGHTTESLNELGYEVNSNNEIIFNKKVIFNENVDLKKTLNYLPRGTIVLNFSASLDDIPIGWALCDGQSYKLNAQGVAIVSNDSDSVRTPNLNGLFVKGKTDGNDGARTKDSWRTNQFNRHTNQTFRITSPHQLPAHNHTASSSSTHNIYRSGDDSCGPANSFDCGDGGGHASAVTISTTTSIGNMGSSHPIPAPNPNHMNLPYIMKI